MYRKSCVLPSRADHLSAVSDNPEVLDSAFLPFTKASWSSLALLSTQAFLEVGSFATAHAFASVNAFCNLDLDGGDKDLSVSKEMLGLFFSFWRSCASSVRVVSGLVLDEVDRFLSCMEPESGNFCGGLLPGILGGIFVESFRRLLIRYLDCRGVDASEGY